MGLFRKKSTDGYVSYGAYKRKTSKTGILASKAGGFLSKTGHEVSHVSKAGYKAVTSDKAKKGYKKAGKSIGKSIDSFMSKPKKAASKKRKVYPKLHRPTKKNGVTVIVQSAPARRRRAAKKKESSGFQTMEW